MTDQTRSPFDSPEDGAAALPFEGPEPFPWPPAETESVLAAFARTWRGAALQPRRFFGLLPADYRLGPALLYYLVIGIAVEGAKLFWHVVLGSVESDSSETMRGALGFEAAWDPLLGFLLSPLVLIFSLFVAAGVTHLLLRMLGGASRPLLATVCIFAFAFSPQILGVVPYVGEAVGFVWMVWVAIIGLGAAHRTTTGRAAAAVLIPVAIGIFFMLIAAFIAATGALLLPTP